MKKPPPNPFAPKPDLMATITQAGMAILIDKLGGSVVISQGDRDALAEKYGGAVAVKIEKVVDYEAYRLTLMRADPAERVDTDPPLS